MVSRKMKLVGHVLRTGGNRNRYKISAKKPEGKSKLGKTWSRPEDNTATNDSLIGPDF
jgi:hypothetical protein